uniref:Uncharacterized protein n=1 Tax=Daphnia magna TaxID=35525 RepID=A0A0P5FAH1_9CRUS
MKIQFAATGDEVRVPRLTAARISRHCPPLRPPFNFAPPPTTSTECMCYPIHEDRKFSNFQTGSIGQPLFSFFKFLYRFRFSCLETIQGAFQIDLYRSWFSYDFRERKRKKCKTIDLISTMGDATASNCVSCSQICVFICTPFTLI